ncbi:cytochrome P460 [Litoreibacter ponti]|uniref:Cytochrome P460 n=1 Tax=Litoreibacter ponti TaxID=1510457 RepID=A0A2T6BLU9_9RHOB|nr:cytochrome P460 family protein [Litoreibacter ponti]PTX57025.1 cytochrome P460 [Litoreibacter ponti]
MTIRATLAAAATATALMASGAHAADCAYTEEDPFDLEAAQIEEIYACLQDKMAEGYAKEGDEIGTAYRGWTATSTRPAVAGPHGNRLLNTFVNDVAAEQYLKFEDGDFVMPVGSVLAKESVSLSKKKKTARPGPLFIMTKMEAGSIPETSDWLYAGLQPNGKVMKVKQSFCHDCHSAFDTQDAMGYPMEEVRVSN